MTNFEHFELPLWGIVSSVEDRCAMPHLHAYCVCVLFHLDVLHASCICVLSHLALLPTSCYDLTLQQRACARIERTNGHLPKSGTIESFDLWEAEFGCDIEDRVGAPYYGDGPKFVCGMEFLSEKADCLVYSIGSRAEDGFELDLLNRAPNCEVSFSAASSSMPRPCVVLTATCASAHSSSSQCTEQ
jgi:hypothetical protein